MEDEERDVVGVIRFGPFAPPPAVLRVGAAVVVAGAGLAVLLTAQRALEQMVAVGEWAARFAGRLVEHADAAELGVPIEVEEETD